MATKLPMTTDGSDISNRVQSYFEQLEQERADLRRERDALDSRNRDLEKSCAVVEARAERAERERDDARAQRDDALQKVVAAATLWGTIGASWHQGETLFRQTAGSIRQSLSGVPSRNGGNRIKPLDEIESGIAKLASAFNEKPKPNEDAS